MKQLSVLSLLALASLHILSGRGVDTSRSFITSVTKGGYSFGPNPLLAENIKYAIKYPEDTHLTIQELKHTCLYLRQRYCARKEYSFLYDVAVRNENPLLEAYAFDTLLTSKPLMDISPRYYDGPILKIGEPRWRELKLDKARSNYRKAIAPENGMLHDAAPLYTYLDAQHREDILRAYVHAKLAYLAIDSNESSSHSQACMELYQSFKKSDENASDPLWVISRVIAVVEG